MKIAIATDHAGFHLKEALKHHLTDAGYEVEDFGAHEYDERDDYPLFMKRAARRVSTDSAEWCAIILGWSGQGEAIVANKFPGVRAAVYYGGETLIPQLARQHNDSNVLSLGAGFLSEHEARRAIDTWLEAPFTEAERHKRRLEEISNIEDGLYGE